MYADDVVLLAPSWRALQYLINVLADCATDIDKTVCMIFPPKDKRKVVTPTFPSFKLDNMDLKFVSEFKYLGHFITNDKHDDEDVLRDVYTHKHFGTQVLFVYVSVKILLLRTFCICFYGMELWQRYNMCSINRLRSSYIRCMKLFFNYPKFYSVTAMLLELGLPSFVTLRYNSRMRFDNQVQRTSTSTIAQLS